MQTHYNFTIRFNKTNCNFLKLIARRCFVLFATHRFELAHLCALYPNVRHKALRVSIGRRAGMEYEFRVSEEPLMADGGPFKNYGIYVAGVRPYFYFSLLAF